MTVTNCLNSLMPELQELVHSNLDLNSALALRQTSKENHKMATSSILWTHVPTLCQKQFHEILQTKLRFSEEDIQRFKKDNKTITDIQKVFLTRELDISEIYLHQIRISGICSIQKNNIRKVTFNTLLHFAKNVTEISFSFTPFNDIIHRFDYIDDIKNISEYTRNNNVTKLILNRYNLRKDRPEDILFLLRILPKISELHLISLYILPDDESTLQINLPNLKVLDLTGTSSWRIEKTDFNESIIFKLVTSSPNLETLIMNGVKDYINDNNKDITYSFKDFFDHFPMCVKLKNLHLQKTEIEDSHLSNIVNACPNLEYIDLSECPNITQSGIEKFQICFQTTYPDNTPITIAK